MVQGLGFTVQGSSYRHLFWELYEVLSGGNLAPGDHLFPENLRSRIPSPLH